MNSSTFLPILIGGQSAVMIYVGPLSQLLFELQNDLGDVLEAKARTLPAASILDDQTPRLLSLCPGFWVEGETRCLDNTDIVTALCHPRPRSAILFEKSSTS